MKRNFFKLLVTTAFTIGLFSCEKDKDNEILSKPHTEFKYIRILVNDELTKQVSLVDPVSLSVQSFDAQHPKSVLYSTQAGRFGVLVATSNNYLQLFDSGFEGHGDHVDVKGTAKFGALTGESSKPTHFKSKGDEIITFNDGDGTLSIAKESNFHVTGAKMSTINAGNVAHHGAMTKFDNGTYAITQKDGSVAGSLPERVKIIDVTGKTLFASSVQTKGIHGNASDGTVSLFGSQSGILVVESTGAQRLIDHPQNFGTAWFSAILEAKGVGKFIGYSAAVGAFLIDVAKSKITPIIESTDLMQVKVDYSGSNLIALLHTGEVQIFDLATNKVVNSASILPVTAKDETQKPQVEATSRYLYITQPKSGEILQISVKDLGKINKIKVSSTPYRVAILGIESSEDH